MSLSDEELLDKLKRVYEMEEVMASLLAGLVLLEETPQSIGDRDRKRVQQVLLAIQKDTYRHKKIVGGMIEQLSGGRS